MQKIKEFLQGKKTYIGAAGLALTSILGWWFGALNGVLATGMLTAAFSIAGLGAKSDRLASETFEALNEAKRVQVLRGQGQKINWAEESQRVAEIIRQVLNPDGLAIKAVDNKAVVTAAASGAAKTGDQW